MGLIARVLDGGPESRRGTAGAARHAGSSRLVFLASCRRGGEVIPKSLQKSGYPADKLVSAQDRFQVFPFGEPSPRAFTFQSRWAGLLSHSGLERCSLPER